MSNNRKNWSHLPWDTIRDAFIVGVSAQELSERYGPPAGTIVSRAHREKWPTPKRLKQQVVDAYYQIMAHPDKKDEVIENLGPLATGIEPTDSAGEIAQKLRARADRHLEFISGLAVDKIKKSSVQAPKTWKELDIADRIARRSLGLDDKDSKTSVQIGIVGGGAIVDLSPVEDQEDENRPQSVPIPEG